MSDISSSEEIISDSSESEDEQFSKNLKHYASPVIPETEVNNFTHDKNTNETMKKPSHIDKENFCKSKNFTVNSFENLKPSVSEWLTTYSQHCTLPDSINNSAANILDETPVNEYKFDNLKKSEPKNWFEQTVCQNLRSDKENFCKFANSRANATETFKPAPAVSENMMITTQNQHFALPDAVNNSATNILEETPVNGREFDISKKGESEKCFKQRVCQNLLSEHQMIEDVEKELCTSDQNEILHKTIDYCVDNPNFPLNITQKTSFLTVKNGFKELFDHEVQNLNVFNEYNPFIMNDDINTAEISYNETMYDNSQPLFSQMSSYQNMDTFEINETASTERLDSNVTFYNTDPDQTFSHASINVNLSNENIAYNSGDDLPLLGEAKCKIQETIFHCKETMDLTESFDIPSQADNDGKLDMNLERYCCLLPQETNNNGKKSLYLKGNCKLWPYRATKNISMIEKEKAINDESGDKNFFQDSESSSPSLLESLKHKSRCAVVPACDDIAKNLPTDNEKLKLTSKNDTIIDNGSEMMPEVKYENKKDQQSGLNHDRLKNILDSENINKQNSNSCKTLELFDYVKNSVTGVRNKNNNINVILTAEEKELNLTHKNDFLDVGKMKNSIDESDLPELEHQADHLKQNMKNKIFFKTGFSRCQNRFNTPWKTKEDSSDEERAKLAPTEMEINNLSQTIDSKTAAISPSKEILEESENGKCLPSSKHEFLNTINNNINKYSPQKNFNAENLDINQTAFMYTESEMNYISLNPYIDSQECKTKTENFTQLYGKVSNVSSHFLEMGSNDAQKKELEERRNVTMNVFSSEGEILITEQQNIPTCFITAGNQIKMDKNNVLSIEAESSERIVQNDADHCNEIANDNSKLLKPDGHENLTECYNDPENVGKDCEKYPSSENNYISKKETEKFTALPQTEEENTMNDVNKVSKQKLEHGNLAECYKNQQNIKKSHEEYKKFTDKDICEKETEKFSDLLENEEENIMTPVSNNRKQGENKANTASPCLENTTDMETERVSESKVSEDNSENNSEINNIKLHDCVKEAKSVINFRRPMFLKKHKNCFRSQKNQNKNSKVNNSEVVSLDDSAADLIERETTLSLNINKTCCELKHEAKREKRKILDEQIIDHHPVFSIKSPQMKLRNKRSNNLKMKQKECLLNCSKESKVLQKNKKDSTSINRIRKNFEEDFNAKKLRGTPKMLTKSTMLGKKDKKFLNKKVLVDMIASKIQKIDQIITKEHQKSKRHMNSKNVSQAFVMLLQLKPVILKVEIIFENEEIRNKAKPLLKKKNFLKKRYYDLYSKTAMMIQGKDNKRAVTQMFENVRIPSKYIDDDDCKIIFDSFDFNEQNSLNSLRKNNFSQFAENHNQRKLEDIEAWNKTVIEKTGLKFREYDINPEFSHINHDSVKKRSPSVHTRSMQKQNNEKFKAIHSIEISHLEPKQTVSTSSHRLKTNQEVRSLKAKEITPEKVIKGRNNDLTESNFHDYAQKELNKDFSSKEIVETYKPPVNNECSISEFKNNIDESILESSNANSPPKSKRRENIRKYDHKTSPKYKEKNLEFVENMPESVDKFECVSPIKILPLASTHGISAIPSKFKSEEQRSKNDVLTNANEIVQTNLNVPAANKNRDICPKEILITVSNKKNYSSNVTKEIEDSASQSLLQMKYEVFNPFNPRNETSCAASNQLQQISNVTDVKNLKSNKKTGIDVENSQINSSANNFHLKNTINDENSANPEIIYETKHLPTTSTSSRKRTDTHQSEEIIKFQDSATAELHEVANHRQSSQINLVLSLNNASISPKIVSNAENFTKSSPALENKNYKSSKFSNSTAIKNKTAVPKKQLKPELWGLIDCGLLKPDFRGLTVHTPEKLTFASIHETGHIISETGKSYTKLLHWCLSIPKFFQPNQKATRAECYKRVYYQGHSLSYYENAYESLVVQKNSQKDQNCVGANDCSTAPGGSGLLPFVLNLSKMKLLLIGDNEVGTTITEIDQWDDVDKWEM